MRILLIEPINLFNQSTEKIKNKPCGFSDYQQINQQN